MMKKRSLIFAVAFVALLGNPGSVTVCAKQSAMSCETYADAAPHSDNYVWRYKTINGVIHRRLYDTINQRWVGDWEACP